MPTQKIATPNYTYEQQWFVDVSDGAETAEYEQCLEDSTFNPSNEDNTLDRKYKARKTGVSYVTGRKVNIEFDIDIISGQALQDWFIKHENDVNVPTKIVRNWTFPDGTSKAQYGEFTVSQNPIDGEAEEFLRATGTFRMVSDGWVDGKFDPKTGKFTPEVTPAG